MWGTTKIHSNNIHVGRAISLSFYSLPSVLVEASLVPKSAPACTSLAVLLNSQQATESRASIEGDWGWKSSLASVPKRK